MESKTQVPVSVPARWSGLETGSKVVFFGNGLGVECQRCGAYNQTNTGHKYCAHITCPIALKEYKRRKRKRTSTLEQVYIPRKRAELEGSADEDDASAPATPADALAPQAPF